MNLFLVPTEGEFDGILESIKRAGVEFQSPANIYELVVAVHTNDYLIAAISANDLMVLQRNYTSILPNGLPTVIHGAPGIIYTSEWIAMASVFPGLDWREMETKFQKSGATAFTSNDVEDRSKSPETRSVRALMSNDRYEEDPDALVTSEDI